MNGDCEENCGDDDSDERTIYDLNRRENGMILTLSPCLLSLSLTSSFVSPLCLSVFIIGWLRERESRGRFLEDKRTTISEEAPPSNRTHWIRERIGERRKRGEPVEMEGDALKWQAIEQLRIQREKENERGNEPGKRHGGKRNWMDRLVEWRRERRLEGVYRRQGTSRSDR